VAAAAATLDHRPLIMDGSSFEPTRSGFFSSLARALDGTDIATAQAAAAALDRADVGTLVVDRRRPPNLAWRTASGWRKLNAELVVGPMDDADARLLVERRGLPADTVTRIVRFGRGHPLALELLAEALARH